MEWLIENWDKILLALTSIVTGASIIARLTPTKKDDKVIEAIMKLINVIAINPKK